MAKLAIGEMIALAAQGDSDEQKVARLRHFDNAGLREILRYTFDSRLEWILPEGSPPFKKTEEVGAEGRLYSEVRKLYLFVKGGNLNLSMARREQLFITLLETVAPVDADLLLKVKERNLPGLSRELVNKAFPEMSLPVQTELTPPTPIVETNLNLKDGDRHYNTLPAGETTAILNTDDTVLVVNNAPSGVRSAPMNLPTGKQKSGESRKGQKRTPEQKARMVAGKKAAGVRKQSAKKVAEITSGQSALPSPSIEISTSSEVVKKSS